MMELSDYRRGLFQWDTGRSLIVTEKDITEVHFQLLPPPSGSTETTDVPVSAGIAKIPDELLQSGLPIRAYAWGDGYSHYDQTFCVTKREKPTGYASDPSDAITLESVQAKLQAEIDGKIQSPQGGDAGDVLKKTESGVEWGQAAGQSDWAENDETAPGYVKNRPFYDGNMVIVDGTFDFLAEGDVYAAKLRDISGVFSESEKYVVNFDGTDYSVSYSDDGFGDWLSTCPIQIKPYRGELIAMTNSGGSHSVSLKGRYKELLPEKYLPSTAAQVMNITYAPSYDELVAARKHYYNGGILTILGDIVTNILGDITDKDGISLTIESGTYTFTASDDHTITMQHYYRLTKEPTDGYAPTAIYLRSDTSNSKKQFKITVDDSGVIKATAIQDADGT